MEDGSGEEFVLHGGIIVTDSSIIAVPCVVFMFVKQKETKLCRNMSIRGPIVLLCSSLFLVLFIFFAFYFLICARLYLFQRARARVCVCACVCVCVCVCVCACACLHACARACLCNHVLTNRHWLFQSPLHSQLCFMYFLHH